MKKEQMVNLSFWAKKFDTCACIVNEREHKTLCGKYNALLGNNYASALQEVCPDCLKINDSKLKS